MNEKTGNVSGTHTEILHLLFDRVGRDVMVTALPWKRCLLAIRLGKQDIVYSASYSEERAGYAYFTGKPLEFVSYVFLVPKGQAHGWNDKKAPRTLPQPIGAPIGFSINENLMADGIKPFNKGLVDDRDALDLLLNNRNVQSIVVAKSVANSLLSRHNAYHRIDILDPPYTPPKAYFIAVSKRAGGGGEAAHSLLRALNRGLEQLNY